MRSLRPQFTSIARFTAILTLTVSLVACMAMVAPPRNLDYSRTRTSYAGSYQASFRPQQDSIVVGKLHSWILHVETAAGAPVDSATITVDGGMPQHGHGLPTKPRVTQAQGHGDHVVEGMKFNMGGWWVVRLRINGAAGTDSVTFNVKL